MADHRKGPRRRGDTLNAAIFRAALDELNDVGYAKLTMEAVAERAKASKASLYRRWPGRMELVMDAVYSVLRDPASPPDTGTLRGDLLAFLRDMAQMLSGPAGEAMRGVLGDAISDEARTAQLRRHSQGAGRIAMREITRRAVERGEIEAGAVTPRRLEVGQAMVRHHFFFQGRPIPDEVITEIVDEVILPVLRQPLPRARDGTPRGVPRVPPGG